VAKPLLFVIKHWMFNVASQANSVAILLSTFRGERFLQAQLDSFVAQTFGAWTLFWRDDGSDDNSVTIMEAFAEGPGKGRCVRITEPVERVGASTSFLILLDAAVGAGAKCIAFADQDDVWLPEKLARAKVALESVPGAEPALYCAQQLLVDAGLNRIGESPPPKRQPDFPAALAQNIAVGCTIMLNRAAAQLVAASEAPSATIHDWWCYLVVSAAGGRLLIDDVPVVLYRQHGGNLVGSPIGTRRRAIAAIRRGPGVFMGLFRAHVAALSQQAALLSPRARRDLGRIERALRGGLMQRLRVLAMPNLRRQTWHETLLFRLWFMLS
jgi:glycosyltransferase involved in cell wall biosynthesis